MSKIGKQPIDIPEGVEVDIKDRQILIKGPKGELKRQIAEEVRVEIKDSQLIVSPIVENKKANALWGLTRALLFNMVRGVTEGFEKVLEIEGVGYRAALEGNKLILSLGFSHPVEVETPEGISFAVDKNKIKVSGIDKELVGRVAANIRALKKPEPYKGKGIRYEGEVIRRKAGKKAVAAAG